MSDAPSASIEMPHDSPHVPCERSESRQLLLTAKDPHTPEASPGWPRGTSLFINR